MPPHAPGVPNDLDESLRNPEPAVVRASQTRLHTPPSESVHVWLAPVGTGGAGGGGTAAVPGGRGGVKDGGEGARGGGAGGFGGRGSSGQGYVQPQAGQGVVVGQAVDVGV